MGRIYILMAYDSLKGWVERLDREGELLRIRESACVDLEIAAAADQESKREAGGKALLFEKPVDRAGVPYTFPVLINGYGSAKRMGLALGRDNVEEIGREVEALVKAKPPAGMGDAWKLLQQGLELRHARPVSVGRGACQEVIHRVGDGGRGLADIPVSVSYTHLTLPTIYSV